MGLLAETLLEATAQDNALTGAEVARLREQTRAAKRKLAQARRERALKAMGVRPTVSGEQQQQQQQTASPAVGAGAAAATAAAGTGDAEVGGSGWQGWAALVFIAFFSGRGVKSSPV